jgi:tRNA threonylcarbamoyladenosine biosynthesis protein TsaB
VHLLADPRLLIVETSSRVGRVAVAEGGVVCGERRLDEARRHARDLTPAVAALLAEQGWCPRDIQVMIVSRGPGSYTGLRVGLMSAKAFAYASGCVLLGVDTFAAVALQAPAAVERIDVLADAQQDKVYVQSFVRDGEDWQPATELAIRPVADWLAARAADASATGPGLRKWAPRLPPDVPVLDESLWEPQPMSLLHLGLRRYRTGQRDDPMTLEPIYLRPSSAEEQWQARNK